MRGQAGRLALPVALATACLAAPAGAAPARLDVERIAAATSRAQATDRYAAYRRPDGDVQVLGVRGRRRAVIDLPEGCVTFTIGGGYLLATCGSKTSVPRVYRLRTGEPATVQGWPGVVERASTGWSVSGVDIGRNWIAVEAVANMFVARWYLQWHTGELVVPTRYTATQVETLDARRPRGELCAPLRRMPRRSDEPPRFADRFYPYQYDRPWGITDISAAPRLPRVQRCGQTRSRPLPCAGCGAVSLGSSAISWGGDPGGILELRCWRGFQVASRRGQVVSVVHTRETVLATIIEPRTSSSAPASVAILRARRPGCG